MLASASETKVALVLTTVEPGVRVVTTDMGVTPFAMKPLRTEVEMAWESTSSMLSEVVKWWRRRRLRRAEDRVAAFLVIATEVFVAVVIRAVAAEVLVTGLHLVAAQVGVARLLIASTERVVARLLIASTERVVAAFVRRRRWRSGRAECCDRALVHAPLVGKAVCLAHCQRRIGVGIRWAARGASGVALRDGEHRTLGRVAEGVHPPLHLGAAGLRAVGDVVPRGAALQVVRRVVEV
eukprot:scaffold1240_cov101-Isochrysis_galbana.AAC.8